MAAGRELTIVGGYNKQRFVQFGSEDQANWYSVLEEGTKKKTAMYPCMGRKHISLLGQNRLIFDVEPRAAFESFNYAYFVVGDNIYQVDRNLNKVQISTPDFATINGNIWSDTLYTPSATYVAFTDGVNFYVYTEETKIFQTCTDPNLTGNIPNPTYVAAFGNRFVVSSVNGSGYSVSGVNLGATATDPSTWFTIADSAIFAQESGNIRQIAVNENIMYIFTDYTTGAWANITSTITAPDGTTTSFPFKKNTSYQFQWGMADPLSLSVDFGMMVWLGQNKSGLIQPVMSTGQAPKPISTKAIDVLFQRDASGNLSPFVEFDANGFLYQYENSVFYRLSAGVYQDYKILDIQTQANAIEYSFDTQQWTRVIELNGERNRIQRHIYFSNRHLVTVQGDNTVYEMSGQFYTNEIRNVSQPDIYATDAYVANPMRYEKVTAIIFNPDYSEFETEWVQIDFVWGDQTFIKANVGYANAKYIIDEDGITFITDEDGTRYLIAEQGNTPAFDEPTYFELFKPSIELLYSDDGGITFSSADNLEFSDLGVYSWRMRWYQMGCSRNRVYKLIAVSPAPIVVLGGWQMTKRVSGGAA